MKFDKLYESLMEGRMSSLGLIATLALSTPTVSYGTEPIGTEVAVSKPDDVTSVIFAETGPISSTIERLWVASAIRNRIKHPGFKRGKLKTMKDVVRQKGQFESLGDKSNSTWVRSRNPVQLTGKDLADWNQSRRLAKGNFTPIDSEVVYFHDKSIKKPKSWDNKYWTAYVIKKTPHFIFYGINPK